MILTLVARVTDGLILAEAMDSDGSGKVADLDTYRQQAKKMFKTLADTKSGTSNRVTVETETNYYFCFIVENDVCYLTLCEKSYPKKLAIKFLEELAKEFDIQYGADVKNAKRPYAFIKFGNSLHFAVNSTDTFIQKTKKLYMDTRSQKNLSSVTEDLSNAHKIMTKNIQDILGRGEKISSVAKRSEDLLSLSSIYKKDAKTLNYSIFWRKPIVAISFVALVILVIYFKFFW